MKILLVVFFLAVYSFAKPLVVYTGVYSVGGDKSLGDVGTFVSSAFATLNQLQANGALPFELLVETDAEETKHLASDPISMAILLTRNDFQIEQYKILGVEKTIQNLGFSVLFYQSRKTEAGTVNAILASIPLNSYMTNEKDLSKVDYRNRDENRRIMTDKIADELLRKRLAQRVKKISIDEIKVNVDCDSADCYVRNFKRSGLELGQSIVIDSDEGDIEAFVTGENGLLEFDDDAMKQKVKANGGTTAVASNLKGYSDETWQVVKVDINSKKAGDLFGKEPVRSQIAQWYSDFLSGSGKAVLPPISGSQWVQNSMGYTEMILANADGDMEKFVMAPARYKVSLGFNGIGSGPIKKNKIEELWAYKLRLSKKVNNQKEKEEDFTTTKNITVDKNGDATRELQDVDVFRDLLHVSIKKFAEQGE